MDIPLLPEVAGDVTLQDYSPKPGLHGVRRVPLKKFRGLEGAFMELMRLREGRLEALPELEVRQVSVSTAAPGRLNAFHLHPHGVQDEAWCVLQGELSVWLVDLRRDSPTAGQRARHHLSAEEPALLYIPSGVAHGYKAGHQGAVMVYAVNAWFDPDQPNEGRLPWDYFGADLWQEDRG